MPKVNNLMGELKQRISLLPIFLRRSSDISQRSGSTATTTSSRDSPSTTAPRRSRSKASISSKHQASTPIIEAVAEEDFDSHPVPGQFSPVLYITTRPTENSTVKKELIPSTDGQIEDQERPALVLERPTPPEDDGAPISKEIADQEALQSQSEAIAWVKPTRRSLETGSVKDSGEPSPLTLQSGAGQSQDYFGNTGVMPTMAHKKVWVKRQGASATLVQITEDDLVDDVRDKILRKYANSLGKTFDSPDVTLRIIPRGDSHGQYERPLGPEESVAGILNQYYPAGQTIAEALVIDIPIRRTPKHSPRVYMDHHRPSENGGDYFSVMPVAMNHHSPHLNSHSTISNAPNQPVHAISILNTGQLPVLPLPSPGSISKRHGSHRPKYGRTATSSPTVLTTHTTSNNPDRVPGTPGLQPLGTPPVSINVPRETGTPPPRTASPRPVPNRFVRPKKKKAPGSASLLDGGVPPISVLIVEDNIINLKLLEAFMKRLKVRWSTAMNGRDAVLKWRTGGFHLILMDIQLPIMSGLEATREIRRLERVNGIGVLSGRVGGGTDPDDDAKQPEGNDKLDNMEQFKSPVIVVALTASSLQSDRNEALAAGCNDFLTKPVNFVWLERKVMEWGCMQALIDFDGWRKWKDLVQNPSVVSKQTKPTIANTATKASPATNKIRPAIESNSDSTDTADAAPPSRPAIPDTLLALNDKTESGDTLDSVTSNDSIDTMELSSPVRGSRLPTLSTQSTASSGSASTVVDSSRSPVSRQSSSQSTRTVTSRDPYPASPVRSPANGTSAASQEEGRRRKRSSLNRPGLSGVAEELEGVGTG